MRERLVSLLLAFAALAAFWALWGHSGSAFDPDANVSRPTTNEKLGGGYAALFDWLRDAGVRARSLRERYTALDDLDVPPRGNLLVLTLPAMDDFHHDEYGALDRWVRRGNTLLIVAALLDQPSWSAGNASSAVAGIESLTGLEFETAEDRKQRLDDTPLAQRVREQDERDARRDAGEEVPEDEDSEVEDATDGALEASRGIELAATGPHVLLREVRSLHLDTDYKTGDFALRIPYDSFVLTLARTAGGEGALFEQRLGSGHLLLSSGGSMFTNRALGEADNAKLFANIVSARVASDGVVLFDDLRQGVSASYNPARFYKDPRLYKTLFILLALWLVWVVGSTRLRAPVLVSHDPSEADLVRHAGGLIARTVATQHAALCLYDGFFARGATGAVNPDRGELWQWLERHAAILPQELDQLKNWYAAAHADRKVPLVPLQNLLDSIARRIHT